MEAINLDTETEGKKNKKKRRNKGNSYTRVTPWPEQINLEASTTLVNTATF